MIVIKIYINSITKLIQGFSVKGHTNKAPLGYDIYCAGISALANSVVLSLRDYLKLSIDSEGTDGNVYCMINSDSNEVTEGIFQTMIVGFKEIQKLIPDIIKIEMKSIIWQKI